MPGYRCMSDPGVASSIPAQSHTFVESDHEIISMVNFVVSDHEIISTVNLLSSVDSLKRGCCQLQEKVCAQSTG